MEVLGWALFGIGSVCTIVMIVLAFMDEVWKGLVGFLCGIYLIYFAIADYDGEYKWPLVIGMLLGWVSGALVGFD